MHPLAAAGSTASSDLWDYVAIFALVAVGWAGVPAIGGAVIAGAAVLASQGSLDIVGVLIAAVIGTEAGGLAAYFVGFHWGRAVMIHPGPWLNRRQRALAAGEVLYAKWGHSAGNVGSLIAGVAIGAGTVLLGVRYHRRRKARSAEAVATRPDSAEAADVSGG